MINNPMMVEIQGEAFTYPANITIDRDGSDLRKAERIVRALSKGQFDAILGKIDDWPAPGAHINADLSRVPPGDVPG
jgi:hypothetical protein